ncbi:MAG TPA: hypothetical protein VIZ68_05685 [Thermoplasmata archaeon]
MAGPRGAARRASLMDLPGQRSLGSVLEEFIGHRDRKYVVEPDGQAVRRQVLVRGQNISGLGKEANRIEEGRVLGQRALRGAAKRYVDSDESQRGRRRWSSPAASWVELWRLDAD